MTGAIHEKIRKAKRLIDDAGFLADLVAISTGDAETLDLQRMDQGGGAGTGAFLYPTENGNGAPSYGLRLIVSPSVNDSAPAVLDSTYLAFFLDGLSFAADAITEFDSNQSRFRLEGPTLLVVRDPGAAVIAAT